MLRSTAVGVLATCLASFAGPIVPNAAADDERATAADLAWLAGCWRQEREEQLTEECWLEPRDGMMVGINRVTGGKRPFFEFLRIADSGGGLAYLADPSGQEPAAFPMIESANHRVVFENPEHDFPQRIIYWLDGEQTLHARIEGVVDGEKRGGDWVYQRANWPGNDPAAE